MIVRELCMGIDKMYAMNASLLNHRFLVLYSIGLFIFNAFIKLSESRAKAIDFYCIHDVSVLYVYEMMSFIFHSVVSIICLLIVLGLDNWLDFECSSMIVSELRMDVDKMYVMNASLLNH